MGGDDGGCGACSGAWLGGRLGEEEDDDSSLPSLSSSSRITLFLGFTGLIRRSGDIVVDVVGFSMERDLEGIMGLIRLAGDGTSVVLPVVSEACVVGVPIIGGECGYNLADSDNCCMAFRRGLVRCFCCWGVDRDASGGDDSGLDLESLRLGADGVVVVVVWGDFFLL